MNIKTVLIALCISSSLVQAKKMAPEAPSDIFIPEGTKPQSNSAPIEAALNALDRYIDGGATAQDKAQLQKYLDYYQGANWTFTVTPPRVALSQAAKKYIEEIKTIARENFPAMTTERMGASSYSDAGKQFLNKVTEVTNLVVGQNNAQ